MFLQSKLGFQPSEGRALAPTPKAMPTVVPIAALAPWQLALLRAAELIEQRGHSVGRALGSNGELCVIGALLLALRGFDDPFAEIHIRADRAILARTVPSMISDWSDTHTQSEVIAMLRAAAATP